MREGGTSFSGRLVGNSGVSGLMLLGIPSVFWWDVQLAYKSVCGTLHTNIRD